MSLTVFNTPDTRPVVLCAGRANPALAGGIADAFGVELGQVTIRNFSDGEVYVKFEESIRGTDLFIIQGTQPPAENLMELLLLVDAAKRASASRITAVIPYFGYARQDRKDRPRVSIAAKLVADLLSTAGVNRILTMDLHAPQIQGFFDIPVDHLYGSALFIEHVKQIDTPNLVVVAPDVGASKRARAYASRLNCDLAMIDKRRPRPNEAEVVNIIGSVSGKNVLLIDDMVDTAGTLVNGATALRKSGALQIWAAATHALLSGPAYDKIEASEISKLLVTDTIPLTRQSDRIEVLGVATYFADAIRRICVDDSVSTLFVE
ncbi:MAG TPA: ribose-phosphate pyrophosphokinase [Rhodothermales bacterium]|nr:ribose-phosphate pyrophosphokinase [Rhodothermales bacterium]